MLRSMRCLWVLTLVSAIGALPAAVWANRPPLVVKRKHVSPERPVAKAEATDVARTVAKHGSLKTLAKALEAAGLDETLMGKGPYTLFAPTDVAFAQLPAGTLESLLKPANKAKLTALLTYHVIPRDVPLLRLMKMSTAPTVHGLPLEIHAKGDKVVVNNARLIHSDIFCTNGVIQLIDTVLTPKE